MRYKLLILDEALLDIDDAIDFYDTTQAKQKFSKKLLDGLKYINENPLHLAKKYSDIRIHNLSPFKHQIHYRFIEQQIQVVAVYYGKSNPKNWTLRLKNQ